MSHTGVYDVGGRRAARSKGASGRDTRESLSEAAAQGRPPPITRATVGSAPRNFPLWPSLLAEAIRRNTGKNGHPQAAKRTEAVAAAFAAARAELIKRAEAEATRVPISPLTLMHEVSMVTPADAVIDEQPIS